MQISIILRFLIPLVFWQLFQGLKLSPSYPIIFQFAEKLRMDFVIFFLLILLCIVLFFRPALGVPFLSQYLKIFCFIFQDRLFACVICVYLSLFPLAILLAVSYSDFRYSPGRQLFWLSLFSWLSTILTFAILLAVNYSDFRYSPGRQLFWLLYNLF